MALLRGSTKYVITIRRQMKQGIILSKFLSHHADFLNMCKIQAPDRYRQSAFIQFDLNREQEPNPSSGADENDQRPVHVLRIWYGHDPLSRSPNIGVVLAFDQLTREMI
uniref:Uncharacterized protein n=1 Tax=Coccidioides posadasii RMSCC 3488 TaxID=454284 RepID=A0A0J6IEQ8_COCPO|nr:hypothetical protein CPAG_06560 [Coccidioides posadasii RMSCC 3488]